MPTYMIASDIVISRAGAMTLSEISRSQVAPILIPSPNVTDNHQYKNAKAFSTAFCPYVLPGPMDTQYLYDKFEDMMEGK